MKDGGVDFAKTDMDFSQPIMFRFKNNIERIFLYGNRNFMHEYLNI